MDRSDVGVVGAVRVAAGVAVLDGSVGVTDKSVAVAGVASGVAVQSADASNISNISISIVSGLSPEHTQMDSSDIGVATCVAGVEVAAGADVPPTNISTVTVTVADGSGFSGVPQERNWIDKSDVGVSAGVDVPPERSVGVATPPYVDRSVGVAAGVAVPLDLGVVIAGSALQSKH